jgi:hypothetical protein
VNKQAGPINANAIYWTEVNANERQYKKRKEGGGRKERKENRSEKENVVADGAGL